MTDKKSADKADQTVRSGLVGPEYPEGTHPVRPASEVTHSATKIRYRDLPDDRKPDPSTVAQEQVLQGGEASA